MPIIDYAKHTCIIDSNLHGNPIHERRRKIQRVGTMRFLKIIQLPPVPYELNKKQVGLCAPKLDRQIDRLTDFLPSHSSKLILAVK